MTKPDDFPDDIKHAAQTAAGEWFRAIGSEEHHFWIAIARAILTERERCALTADNICIPDYGEQDEHFAASHSARSIAAAIRKGSRP